MGLKPDFMSAILPIEFRLLPFRQPVTVALIVLSLVPLSGIEYGRPSLHHSLILLTRESERGSTQSNRLGQHIAFCRRPMMTKGSSSNYQI